jgi:hypothetical protein
LRGKVLGKNNDDDDDGGKKIIGDTYSIVYKLKVI